MIHVQARGVSVPALGFGTWRLAGDECRVGVLDALAAGYRSIDTARRYDNEESIGAALVESSVPRDEIYLCTKLDLDCTAEMVRQSAKQSLRDLRTDYLDLLLMHWPNSTVPLAETLEAMSQLQESGQVRSIGVSNFPSSLLRQALDIAPIVANQVEYHPYLSQRSLIEMADQHDLILAGYAPLARGRVLDDPVLADIAAEHGKSPTQVTLRWLVQQPHVIAIPKTNSPKRRRANLDVFDFALTDDEMDRIHALDTGYRIVDPAIAPEWDR